MDTVAFLFTDIEGSTRLWEQDSERMASALASHDALVRSAVERHRGTVVKMIGDGVHAAFDDPADGIAAALDLQQSLSSPAATHGIPLPVRCGLHVGPVQRRDNDYFGSVVNRAARVMSVAHGGQVLLSGAVAASVRQHLPSGAGLVDLGRVRLRDLASPERLFQLVHPDLRQAFPAPRSLEVTPNNLPQQLGSFIGREHEQREVRSILQRSRLVSLVGTGGMGKTRLALQVAADMLDEFPDGIWLVELAAIADGRLVAQLTASVLGVREEIGRPVQEALLKYVVDREMLLILDNCEHLLSACAEFAKRLLQSGARLRILATSREHLHLVGESIMQIDPLSVPAAEMEPTTEQSMLTDAVRLFVERAVAARPDFRIADDNLHSIAQICCSLDGIPLAIELAAARARTLSVKTIAARLHDRFRLLCAGDTTVLPRQRTLQASIDWSHDLLSPCERALLRRLSVFVGGVTLDAAEAVGADGDVAHEDVFDLLSRLVEKSLVVLEPHAERYRLLETVREYAQGRLDDAGETHSARTRHLQYFVRLAESAIQALVGPEQKLWLARFDHERENLLAAHAWCDHANIDSELGLRLVGAIQLYWLSRDLGELGHRVTTEALTRPSAQAPSSARCRALFAAGQIGYFTGHYHEAQHHLEENISLARTYSDRANVAGSLVLLGHVRFAQGSRSDALRYFKEGLDVAREAGDPAKLHAALNALAELHRGEGALDAAAPLYEESLALQRERGEHANIVVSLYNLAAVAIARGAADRAQPMVREALTIARELGSKYLGELVLDIASALATVRGEMDRAARLHGAAEAVLQEIGQRRDPADEAFLAPLATQVRCALGPAAHATSEAAGHAMSYEAVFVEIQAWLDQLDTG